MYMCVHYIIQSDSECEEEEGEGSDVEGELAEQQREIAALHEQRALLMRLKDQQSQVCSNIMFDNIHVHCTQEIHIFMR